MKKSKINLFILIFLFCIQSMIFANDYQIYEEIAKSIVMIVPHQKTAASNEWESLYTSGSGSVVDLKEGLILSNYHVIANHNNNAYPCDKALIYQTGRLSQKPQPIAWADVVQVSTELDLALLKITESYQGQKMPVLREIGWNAARSANEVGLTEPLKIFGYPPYGAIGHSLESITVTSGTVSGFLEEPHKTGFPRAWIKTDSSTSWGNSGGAATDSNGAFLGVPTQISADQAGGRIGLIRPVDLAAKLIAAYKAGKKLERDQINPTAYRCGFSRVLFCKGFDSSGRPVEPGLQFYNNNTKAVYALFQYQGLQKRDEVEYHWFHNSKPIINHKDTWNNQAKGTFSTDLTYQGKLLPVGEYSFAIYVNDIFMQEGKFIIKQSNQPPQKEITLQAAVIDRDSRTAIANARVLVLKQGVSIFSFMLMQDQKMVASAGQTDQNGKCELSPSLIQGETYTILVFANGYEVFGQENGLKIQGDANDKQEISIEIKKK